MRSTTAIVAIGQPLTVLGWSLGGQVALQWALRAAAARSRGWCSSRRRRRSCARRLAACAMTADTLARFGDELRVAYRLTLQRFLTLQMQRQRRGPRARLHCCASGCSNAASRRRGARGALALLRDADLRRRCPSRARRHSSSAGESDALVPLAATHALAAAMPKATHATIAGAAHAPFLSHRAAVPRRACRAFVDG